MSHWGIHGAMEPIGLQTLANLAEIIGGATVVGGVVFAVWQIRQFREQRRDMAAIEIIRSLLSPEFIKAFRLLAGVRDGISLKALREMGQEYEEAAIKIGAMGETIGFIVYRGAASIELVREQAGGLLLEMWDKLHVWVKETREEQSYDRWLEWWQWMVDRLNEYDARTEATAPAYERFADWKPRR